jgi:hypothetical protein
MILAARRVDQGLHPWRRTLHHVATHDVNASLTIETDASACPHNLLAAIRTRCRSTASPLRVRRSRSCALTSIAGACTAAARAAPPAISAATVRPKNHVARFVWEEFISKLL